MQYTRYIVNIGFYITAGLRPGTMLTNITVPSFMVQFRAINREKRRGQWDKSSLYFLFFKGAHVGDFHPYGYAPFCSLKVVTNEKQGGSGRWQMIGIGLA
jgi:hypothetical protein